MKACCSNTCRPATSDCPDPKFLHWRTTIYTQSFARTTSQSLCPSKLDNIGLIINGGIERRQQSNLSDSLKTAFWYNESKISPGRNDTSLHDSRLYLLWQHVCLDPQRAAKPAETATLRHAPASTHVLRACGSVPPRQCVDWVRGARRYTLRRCPPVRADLPTMPDQN